MHKLVLPLASDSWQSFLDAPVPFLAGVPRGHPVTRRLGTSGSASASSESDMGPHDHLFVVDLNDNTVRLGDGGEPPLPGIDGLAAALQPIVDRLSRVDIAPARLGTAGVAVDAMVLEAVEQILALFAKWHAALLRQLQGNCNVFALAHPIEPSSHSVVRTLRCYLTALLPASMCLSQASNPFDVDECVGEFTGRHAEFLNAFSRTQMFAVYAGQHMSESAPEPEREMTAEVGVPAGEPDTRAVAAELGGTSSSDDGEDKI